MIHIPRYVHDSWLLAAALLMCCAASAQVAPASGGNNKSGTVAASGAENFEALVKQDVAKGLYTAEQGDALIVKFEAANARVTDSMNTAADNMVKTVSLMATSDQTQALLAGIEGSLSSNGKAQLGGTPEQIADQANAIYAAQLQTMRVGVSAYQTVQPVVQQSLDELNGIVAERSALISANPNVSVDQKFYVQQESNKVQLAAQSLVDKTMGTQIANGQAAIAYLEANPELIKQKYAQFIQSMVEKYGPDPVDWLKSGQIHTGDIVLDPPPKSDDSSGTGPMAPSNDPSKSGKPSLLHGSGTIPGNEPDPALSASRNSSGQASGTNSTGSGNGPDPALDAYRNQPGGRAIDAGVSSAAAAAAAMPGAPPPPKPTPPAPAPVPNGIAAGVADAAEAVQAMTDKEEFPDKEGTPTPQFGDLENQPWPAERPLVEGNIFGTNDSNAPLPALPVFDDAQSFEYGDAIPVTALLPIYAGYRLSDQTGDAMMSLNLQVAVPSAVMTVPSMQVTGMPSDVMMSLDLQPALCGR